MKIEYYAYYPIVKTNKFYPYGDRQYPSISDIRKQLPSHIAKELMEGNISQNANNIRVEAKKTDIVAYLDKVMKLKKNNFSKIRDIEITEEEIGNYDYFFIDLRSLDWGKQIYYEFTRPTCELESCPYDAQITSPTRIRSKSIRSLNFGRVWDIWKVGVRFIISEKLKNIFDSEQLTGLKYEPCLIEHQKGKKGETQVFEDRFFVAEIAHGIPQHASHIFLHEYCKKHSIIISFDRCNPFISRDAVLPYDFQMINRLVVKGQEYFYNIPTFFVSRKVLEILLKNCKDNLRQRGFLLKKSFVPVNFGMR